MCFSARRASSCNTPRPSSNGCSAASSCCFTGHSPLSLPACPEIQWRCWPEEGRWVLAGENTKWTHWRGPVHTHSHILTNLKTCPYCSLGGTLRCRALSSFFAFKLWRSNGFNYSFTVMVVLPSSTAERIPLSSTPRMNVCCCSRGIRLCVSQKNMFAFCTSVKPNIFLFDPRPPSR